MEGEFKTSMMGAAGNIGGVYTFGKDVGGFVEIFLSYTYLIVNKENSIEQSDTGNVKYTNSGIEIYNTFGLFFWIT